MSGIYPSASVGPDPDFVNAHGDDPLGGVRSGSLEVRLALTPKDIDALQALRFRVFYEECGATPSLEMKQRQRDFDDFDHICDHLIVLDRSRGDSFDAVIGTYRLMRRSVARRHRGFYTAREFDVSPLESIEGEILELGRSCVDANYRTRPTVELLWRGIAAYVFRYNIQLMFGCASLPGTDPTDLAVPLSYLVQHHLAPQELRPKAHHPLYRNMNLLAGDAFDPRRALAALPPLVKGYLRLGGFVGDGAVIDRQFNTTDVCVVVKTDLITDKYYQHYLRKSSPVSPAQAA
jgi:putative hemolysin